MAKPRNDYVTISDFGYELQNILNQYGDEVQTIVDEEVESVSKETLQRIKRDSPKDTGAYAKGWRIKKAKDRLVTRRIIYNATRYWLVHLLEYGWYNHRTRARFDGIEHIRPAERWAKAELVKRVRERL